MVNTPRRLTPDQEAALERVRRTHALRELADQERQAAITDATALGIPHRLVAHAADVSGARVHQMVAAAPGADREQATKGPTLHAAIESVLKASDGQWMSVQDVTRAIAEGDLYVRGDGQSPPANQVRARISKYPDLFEGTDDGRGLVRLRR